MDLSDRFARTWDEWDAHVHNAREATAYLTSAKDEKLLELLAGESEKSRKYERDIIATEIGNRLTRRSIELPGGATDVYHAARIAHETAAKSQISLHTAGGLLKAQGADELGASISAAAIVILESTRTAMDAARKHLADLQAALAQSRVADLLLEDAAHAAIEAAIRSQQAAPPSPDRGRAEAPAARPPGVEVRDRGGGGKRVLREEGMG